MVSDYLFDLLFVGQYLVSALDLRTGSEGRFDFLIANFLVSTAPFSPDSSSPRDSQAGTEVYP